MTMQNTSPNLAPTAAPQSATTAPAPAGQPVYSNARHDAPHGHDGEFSMYCDPCKNEYLDEQESYYRSLGYTTTEASSAALDAWVEEFGEPAWT